MTETISIPPKKRRQIEEAATDILSKFQPQVLGGNSSFDVEDFAEFELEDLTRVKFTITDQMPFGILGCTDPFNMEMSITQELAAATSIPGRRRYRSTLAHEIGHCFFHIKPIQKAGGKVLLEQKKKDVPSFYRASPNVEAFRDPEWQAWEMAGSLLMPKNAVFLLLNQKATLKDLEEIFDVNGAFVQWRLRKLGLYK